MGEHTTIGWTHHTFNAWWGCTEVSEACDFCYAREMDKHWYPVVIGQDADGDDIKAAKHWTPPNPYRTFGDKHWAQLMDWDRAAELAGEKRRVFMSSMCDVLDARAPKLERAKLWDYCRHTPHLIKQLLTKRPQNYIEFVPADLLHDPLVWKGFTAENQKWFDLRWAHVQPLPGIRWVSYEPGLEPLSIKREGRGVPDWIICGGESGPKRRTFEQQWAENLLAECREVGTAFFMKQMGARTPEIGKSLIPAHLNIQEFPA